jgi:hypothetical protein
MKYLFSTTKLRTSSKLEAFYTFSPARHSRVYVHADKFENLRFKSWQPEYSVNDVLLFVRRGYKPSPAKKFLL